MRAPPALLAAMALLAAGCAAPGDSTEHVLEGAFATIVTPADILELGDRVRAEGGDLTTTAKTPPTFRADGLTLAACEVVRGYAIVLITIERLGECTALVDVGAVATAQPQPVVAGMPISDL